MEYYLAVERNPDSYEEIAIKKTQLGRNLFINTTSNCTLSEIDRFTTEYINLEQFLHELYCDRVTPWPNSSVAIVSVSDGKIITIENDLLFKESKKYLDNPYLTLEYLTNELSACNIEFVRDLFEKIENPNEKEILKMLIKEMEAKLEYDIPIDMNVLTCIADLLVYNTDDSAHIQEPRLYEYPKIHNVVSVIQKNENRIKEQNQSHKRIRTKNT